MLAMIATLGGSAHAHKPVSRPRIVRECPNAASWPLLLDCFKQHGLVATTLGTLDAAKLLSVAVDDGSHGLEGFVMYVRDGAAGPWHLGGLLQEGGFSDDYNLLRFERVGRYGYRIDLATTLASAASLDGVTSVPSMYRQISASFCNGSSYRCTQVITHCEQIVHGQTITVFDGTLTVRDNTLSIKGAGSQPSCGDNVEESF